LDQSGVRCRLWLLCCVFQVGANRLPTGASAVLTEAPLAELSRAGASRLGPLLGSGPPKLRPSSSIYQVRAWWLTPRGSEASHEQSDHNAEHDETGTAMHCEHAEQTWAAPIVCVCGRIAHADDERLNDRAYHEIPPEHGTDDVQHCPHVAPSFSITFRAVPSRAAALRRRPAGRQCRRQRPRSAKPLPATGWRKDLGDLRLAGQVS
jgi:hypothetical protein